MGRDRLSYASLISSTRTWPGLLVILMANATACSTTATVSRINGPDLDVHFAGSDRENIYVSTPAGPRPIPRRDVTDIDHPGDTVAILGASWPATACSTSLSACRSASRMSRRFASACSRQPSSV